MTYPSDLTDAHWALIKDHFDTGNYGKSRKYRLGYFSQKMGCGENISMVESLSKAVQRL